MAISKYQKQKNNRLAVKSLAFYKEGYTLREVGKMVDRSYEWVRQAIKPLIKNDN